MDGINKSPTKDYTGALQLDIREFIRAEVSEQICQYSEDHESFPHINELKRTQEFLDWFEEDYKSSADKIRGRMEWVNSNMLSYESKFHQRFEQNCKDLKQTTNDYLKKKKNKRFFWVCQRLKMQHNVECINTYTWY